MNLVKTSRILDSYFPYDVSNIILEMVEDEECEIAKRSISRNFKEMNVKTLHFLYNCSYYQFVLFFKTLDKYEISIMDQEGCIYSSIDLEEILFRNEFNLAIRKLYYMNNRFGINSLLGLDIVENYFINKIYTYLDEPFDLDRHLPILMLHKRQSDQKQRYNRRRI